MTDVKRHLTRLDELERQHAGIQQEIDTLMAEMERVPPEQRSDSDWGPTGTLTRRYLDLIAQEKDLLADVRTVTLAIEQANPTTPNA